MAFLCEVFVFIFSSKNVLFYVDGAADLWHLHQEK